VGLVPILFSTGVGSEIMKSIAAPMIGGLVTSTVLELTIYPAIYMLWRRRMMTNEIRHSSGSLQMMAPAGRRRVQSESFHWKSIREVRYFTGGSGWSGGCAGRSVAEAVPVNLPAA